MLLDFEKDIQIKDLQNNEMSNRNCPDKCETLIREFAGCTWTSRIPGYYWEKKS